MNKPIKTIAVALAAIASMSVQQTEACTRATYIGPDNTVITGVLRVAPYNRIRRSLSQCNLPRIL